MTCLAIFKMTSPGADSTHSSAGLPDKTSFKLFLKNEIINQKLPTKWLCIEFDKLK
jgi:hypothetical protein